MQAAVDRGERQDTGHLHVRNNTQKPIKVQPGIYEINNPSPSDPFMVTTNFSITYFSVANEVENTGLPAWLLVADSAGINVWCAAGGGYFTFRMTAGRATAVNGLDII